MTDDTDECDEEPRLPEATPANDPGWCEYDGCLEFAKGDDGLCVKHLVAWRRGDAEAEAAHRRHLVKQPGACVDESKGGWKRQAADNRRRNHETGENMTTKPKKDKGPCRVEGCGRPAKTRGLCLSHYQTIIAGPVAKRAALQAVALPPRTGKGAAKAKAAAATGGQARPRPAGRDEALARRVPAAPAGGSPLAGTIVQEQAIELFRVAADAIGLPVAGFRVRGDVVVVNTENEQMVRIRDGRAEPVTIVPVAAVV